MNSPYKQYPSAGNDVFNSMVQKAGATNDIEAAKRQDVLSNQQRAFSQSFALQGLQNEIATQQQRDQLKQTRMDGAYGAVNGILQGLYQ